MTKLDHLPKLPCPFCGSTGLLIRLTDAVERFRVECREAMCCMGPWRFSEESAVKVWNIRAEAK